MELVTTYSPKKVWNHLEDHDKKGGVALFVLPDQSSYDTFFPVVGFLKNKWGDTYNFITPIVVSTSDFSAYILKYRDTLNHYTLIFQLPVCSNLTTFIPNTLGYTKAEYDLYLASISTYHAIAPASTTENNIPQWDSTNMFLKDGLTLATTLGTPGVDTKVPSEKAVRDAIPSVPDVILELYAENFNLDSVDTGSDYGTAFGITKSLDFSPDVRGAVWFTIPVVSGFDVDSDINMAIKFLSNGGSADETFELELSLWAIDSGDTPSISTPDSTGVETITLVSGEINKLTEKELALIIGNALLNANTKEIVGKLTRDGVTDTGNGTLQIVSMKFYQ